MESAGQGVQRALTTDGKHDGGCGSKVQGWRTDGRVQGQGKKLCFREDGS